MGSNGWAKLDDKAWANHKLIRAGAAVALWTASLSWASFNNTDRLPKGPALFGVFPCPSIDHQEMAAKLVEVGLWVEHADHYQIHEFRTYNPTKEERKRAKAAERQRKKRARDAAERDAECDTDADVTPSVTERDKTPEESVTVTMSRRDPGRVPCTLSPRGDIKSPPSSAPARVDHERTRVEPREPSGGRTGLCDPSPPQTPQQQARPAEPEPLPAHPGENIPGLSVTDARAVCAFVREYEARLGRTLGKTFNRGFGQPNHPEGIERWLADGLRGPSPQVANSVRQKLLPSFWAWWDEPDRCRGRPVPQDPNRELERYLVAECNAPSALHGLAMIQAQEAAKRPREERA